MNRKLGDTITLDFTVHLPTTGAVSDADSLPTVEVFEDDTDSTLAGASVTKRTGKTGNYRVAVVATTGNGFEVGKSYNVVVTAVAGTVTAKAVIGSFFIDSKRLADLNDLGGTAQTGDAFGRIGLNGAGLTALGDARIANLDAAVSTRSTLTAQQVWEYATRTLSSFGTLVADAAAAVWANITRSLTDKAGFSISGTKQTLDALEDLSSAGAQAAATAALNAYDPPTKAELDSAVSPLALEAQAQAHTAAALAAYDPPTRAEATSDKAEIAALATKVLQVLANRLVVVPATGGYTIYADDGVTPLLTGTISGTGRSVPTWP